jgi:serine/threonine protein phosphatase PrpC
MRSIQILGKFIHRGKRTAQEDAILLDREKGVFVVADGFGGPKPGLAAAEKACEAIRSFLFKQAQDLDATLPFVLRAYFSLAGNVLFNSLIFANRKIYQMNHALSINERGGASVLAGFIDGDLLVLANVGGCSAWLLRAGKSVELVTPRRYGRMKDVFNEVNLSQNNPTLMRTDMTEINQVPLMALGMSEDLEPEIFEYRIQANDCVLIATDGFPTYLLSNLNIIQQNEKNSDLWIEEAIKLFQQQVYNDNVALGLFKVI